MNKLGRKETVKVFSFCFWDIPAFLVFAAVIVSYIIRRKQL